MPGPETAYVQKTTCYFYNLNICHQNCNCGMVLRDDARLVPCDSHLWAMWAMQSLWSIATIEIRPQYKHPCHCTILGTSTRSLQLHRNGNFHTLMAKGDSLKDV